MFQEQTVNDSFTGFELLFSAFRNLHDENKAALKAEITNSLQLQMFLFPKKRGSIVLFCFCSCTYGFLTVSQRRSPCSPSQPQLKPGVRRETSSNQSGAIPSESNSCAPSRVHRSGPGRTNRYEMTDEKQNEGLELLQQKTRTKTSGSHGHRGCKKPTAELGEAGLWFQCKSLNGPQQNSGTTWAMFTALKDDTRTTRLKQLQQIHLVLMG